jgi:hypothetical protein
MSFQLWRCRNGEFFEAASLELGVPGARVASGSRPWSSSWVIWAALRVLPVRPALLLLLDKED